MSHLCPKCGDPLPAPTRPEGKLTERWPHFPFCSKRCRMVDLGQWMTGQYAIPGTPVDPDDLPRDLPRTDEEL